MNVNSLAHSYMPLQPESSWIDDPFQLGTPLVKGITNMNHKRNLDAYALDLVGHYADYIDKQFELPLSKLSDSDKSELTRLLMEATDRETNECVHGNDFSIENEYTCALLAMLKNDCQETREHFAEITRQNVITYYTNALQQVLDDACTTYLYNEYNNAGFYDYQCQTSGEIFWSKR